jgi:SRSO17 transposase
VQDFIDRRFFRSKYITEKALEQFAVTSRQDVELERLTDVLLDVVEKTVQRVEQLEGSETYVRGLLGDAARKNVEQMALGLGENVRDLQYFIGQSPWKTEPVIEVHQRLVAEILGEADGVALIDESGVVK